MRSRDTTHAIIAALGIFGIGLASLAYVAFFAADKTLERQDRKEAIRSMNRAFETMNRSIEKSSEELRRLNEGEVAEWESKYVRKAAENAVRKRGWHELLISRVTHEGNRYTVYGTAVGRDDGKRVAVKLSSDKSKNGTERVAVLSVEFSP